MRVRGSRSWFGPTVMAMWVCCRQISFFVILDLGHCQDFAWVNPETCFSCHKHDSLSNSGHPKNVEHSFHCKFQSQVQLTAGLCQGFVNLNSVKLKLCDSLTCMDQLPSECLRIAYKSKVSVLRWTRPHMLWLIDKKSSKGRAGIDQFAAVAPLEVCLLF